MAAITVRNLSDETHRALKARAVLHNRSTEAEVRAILDEVVGGERVRLGTLLVDIAQTSGMEIEISRDSAPHDPLSLA